MKQEWLKKLYMLIPGYMRYRDIKPGDGIDDCDWIIGGTEHKYRTCMCSRCGAVINTDKNETQTMTRELWTAKHNDYVKCPTCDGAVQMKNMKILKNSRSLSGHYRTLIAERINHDHVKLHAFYIMYSFPYPEDALPDIDYIEDMTYSLTPGKAEVMKFEPYKKEKWQKTSIREPWPLVNACGGWQVNYYSFIADELLDDTFLQYLPFADIELNNFAIGLDRSYGWSARSEQTPWGRFLSYAAIYPQLEFACKIGAWDFVRELVVSDKRNVRLINWKARKPGDFLRMSASDAKKVIQDGCGKEQCELIHYRKLKPDQAREWLKHGFTHSAVTSAEDELGDDGEAIVKYLTKQGQDHNGVYLLKDYRSSAVKLGRDINVPSIRWPKQLVPAHDEVTSSVKVIEDKERNRLYHETYERLRKDFEFVSGDYMAIVPQNLSDIKLEGKIQHHCVGGYTERHASGQCVIIFIRKRLLPAIPLYTVELKPDGKLVQVQGYHNEATRKPTGEAAEFMEEWKAEINRRLSKNKKRKVKTA